MIRSRSSIPTGSVISQLEKGEGTSQDVTSCEPSETVHTNSLKSRPIKFEKPHNQDTAVFLIWNK